MENYQDQVNDKFDSVSSNYLGKAQHTKVIEQMEAQRGEKSNKCNQCDYASSQASNLRRHLKMHSGEKSSKCK